VSSHGSGESPRERPPQQRVESAGALLDGDDAAPHRGERVTQGGAGPVVSRIEFGDEEEADAGVDGRHARKVIR
jgi:hypothetical protein